MADDFEILRDHDESHRRRRESQTAELAARKARQQEWDDAWQAVVAACGHGDDDPEAIPDLSPFLRLASVLSKRQDDKWLPEMRDTARESLGDMNYYRPGHLFVILLLMAACKPRATAKQLASQYQKFSPSVAPLRWRATAAGELKEFIEARNHQHEIESAKNKETQATEAARQRIADLIRAANRRRAIEKQLFAAHWHAKGMRPAEIRDKWNLSRPSEPIGDGTSGWEDIKKAIKRGREFLDDNNTTAAEVAALLDLAL